MDGKSIIKKLSQNGWEVARITGSHHIMKKEGHSPVSVPVHGSKDLPIGTVKSISKQTEIKLI